VTSGFPPVPRSIAPLIAAAAIALAGVVGLAQATAGSASVPMCHARLELIAHGQGSPDDLVWDGPTLLVSDIKRGRIGVVAHGHVRTIVRHLREPEGIVPGPRHSLIVAEQGTNRVLEISLPKGTRTTLAKLPLPAGRTGIDGINADRSSSVFLPDSARGRLYILDLRTHKLSLVGWGMNRPVAAVAWRHGVVVADEYANTVWRIAGKRTALAPVPVPDDLAIVGHHLIATSLLGEVWEVAPHLRMLTSAFKPTTSDPQGLVANGPDAVIVADEARNGIYRLSGLSRCL
jgi:hypothetical protein